VEDLLRQYPALQPADLRACFAYAAEVLAQAAPPEADMGTADWVRPAEEAPPTQSPPAPEATTLPPPSKDTSATPATSIPILGYEVLGKLGEGGMGVVYKARHLRLNRIVALKMILAGEHASEEMIARFAIEAEAVAQMQHPGIVQIYEIGEHGSHSFLALEYVAGGSLAAQLDDKPWSADKAAELVEKLARAMQAAHERGIIHRDLKPANVLLTEDGQPKITDFGLAKRLQDSTGRTRTGEIMGTPEYMAPEQAAGKKDVGPAADVYALGAILYRLLTGRPPFQANTSLDTLMLVLEQDPTPVRQINWSVPRDLETIALKCLSKEPAKRYASMAELAEDLQRFLDGEPIQARRLTARQRLNQWLRKRPGAALCRWSVGCLLLGLLVIGLYFGRPEFGTVMISVGTLTLLGVVSTKLRSLLKPLIISIQLSLASMLVVMTYMPLAPPPTAPPPTPVAPEGMLKEPLIEGQEGLLKLAKRATELADWVPYDLTTSLKGLPIILFTLSLIPLLCGIVIGTFSSIRGRAVGFCLLFLILSSSFSDRFCFPVRFGIAAGAYYGLISQFVRSYHSGNIVDIVFGSLLGSMVGLFGMSVVYGCVALTLLRDRPVADLGWTVILLIYGGFILSILVGTVLGAVLGAASGKRLTRQVDTQT
jgi:serine/threonine protein kinase